MRRLIPLLLCACTSPAPAPPAPLFPQGPVPTREETWMEDGSQHLLWVYADGSWVYARSRCTEEGLPAVSLEVGGPGAAIPRGEAELRYQLR